MGEGIGTGRRRRRSSSSSSVPEKIEKQLGFWCLDGAIIHLIQRNPREEPQQWPQQEEFEPGSFGCRSGGSEDSAIQERLRKPRLDAPGVGEHHQRLVDRNTVGPLDKAAERVLEEDGLSVCWRCQRKGIVSKVKDQLDRKSV